MIEEYTSNSLALALNDLETDLLSTIMEKGALYFPKTLQNGTQKSKDSRRYPF